MKMYQRMLIPTDGSEISAKAIANGVGLAKKLGSKVLGLYVIDISAFSGIATDAIWENMRTLLEDEGKKALGTLEDESKKGAVGYEVIMREGRPAEEIVKAAKELSADVIVMGTAWRSGLDKFLLGSVTEKVMRTAPCPVLVIRR